MNDSKLRYLKMIVARLGFPASTTLLGLWDTMVSEREAAWIAHLPATAREIAERLGEDASVVAEGLGSLYERGLALRGEATPDGPRYLPEENAGTLMDLVLFDRRYVAWYGKAFLDAWRQFYNQELVHTYEHPEPARKPFRVLAVGEQVKDSRAALPYDRVAAIVRGARRISVEHCPCRTRERACHNELETCLGLDQVADYMIARGVGREISADEALSLLKHCEDLGLVHISENADQPQVICNCCPCCCVFLRAMTVHAKHDVLAASRYVAVVDASICVACGRCVEQCPFDAMELTDGAVHVFAEACMGCGLCASSCPTGAIVLAEVRPQEHIPHESSGFGKMLGG